MPSRSSAPDGGLGIWKPRGPTSRAIINQVQVRLDFKGLGHCGTLDPMASGVLVIIGVLAGGIGGQVQRDANTRLVAVAMSEADTQALIAAL